MLNVPRIITLRVLERLLLDVSAVTALVLKVISTPKKKVLWQSVVNRAAVLLRFIVSLLVVMVVHSALQFQ